MRRVVRLPLDKKVTKYLEKRQSVTNANRGVYLFSATSDWEIARKTKSLKAVLSTLQRMMDRRERCMYCLDSHGTDIEHFYPKTSYPEKMFFWQNLLLCCTECGRFKGDRFPLENGQPLLIDPTIEDPWDHLDFDPDTGNIVARFNLQTNNWSQKGSTTVEVLHLNCREALAAVYKKTFRRLSSVIESWLHAGGLPNLEVFIVSLKDADDHGLLGWCFNGTGQKVYPFCDFHDQYPEVWSDCVAAILIVH